MDDNTIVSKTNSGRIFLVTNSLRERLVALKRDCGKSAHKEGSEADESKGEGSDEDAHFFFVIKGSLIYF